MYDIIGDIHGHADKLKSLLLKLGYTKKESSYKHPARKALFVGDYIDRGPANPEVVNIVRAMVDNEQAVALMGNHEYNAILYNTIINGKYARSHSNKNNKQHRATLDQYGNDSVAYQEAIAWFKTLPLFYEDEHIRAIHACWHQPSVEIIKVHTSNGVLSEENILQATNHTHPLHRAVEICLKGLETHLPAGVSFLDKDGHKRQSMRIKWWENPSNKTLQDMSVLGTIDLPDVPFNKQIAHYPTSAKPVFFGHYWLQGAPSLQKDNVCCLDYSVAKGGNLCAYRWNGEQILNVENLVSV